MRNKNSRQASARQAARSAAQACSTAAQEQRHADQLLQTIHAQHKRGKTRSAEDTARAILDVYRKVSKPRVQRELSFDGVVKLVAEKERVSAVTLRTSIRRFVHEGTLQPPTPERITRADPEHPLFLESGSPLHVQKLLFRIVSEAQK